MLYQPVLGVVDGIIVQWHAQFLQLGQELVVSSLVAVCVLVSVLLEQRLQQIGTLVTRKMAVRQD